MKIHFETSHEATFRTENESGSGWKVYLFIKPHLSIDIPLLKEWLIEKLGAEVTETETVTETPKTPSVGV